MEKRMTENCSLISPADFQFTGVYLRSKRNGFGSTGFAGKDRSDAGKQLLPEIEPKINVTF